MRPYSRSLKSCPHAGFSLTEMGIVMVIATIVFAALWAVFGRTHEQTDANDEMNIVRTLIDNTRSYNDNTPQAFLAQYTNGDGQVSCAHTSFTSVITTFMISAGLATQDMQQTVNGSTIIAGPYGQIIPRLEIQDTCVGNNGVIANFISFELTNLSQQACTNLFGNSFEEWLADGLSTVCVDSANGCAAGNIVSPTTASAPTLIGDCGNAANPAAVGVKLKFAWPLASPKGL